MSAQIQGNKSRLAPAIGLLALFGIFCIFNEVKGRFIHDEVGHIPVVVDFGRMLAGQKAWSLNYNDSLGPAFYFFYSLFWLISKSLFVLRVPSFLFAAANVTLIYRCLRTTESSFAACLIAYLSGPWSILSACTVHGEQMAFFTTLVAIICFCTEPGSRRAVGQSAIGWAMLALTPMVRIYSVFVFPAITGLALVNRRYRNVIPYVLAALLPSCIVFWIWKGITPPAFAATQGASGLRLMLNPAYLMRPLMLAATLGVYSWPWLFSIPKDHLPKFKFLILLLIGCLLIGFVTPLGSAGPLDSLLRKILHLGPLPVPFYSVSEQMTAVRPIYGFGLFVFSIAGIACFRQARAAMDQISAVCALALLCYALSLGFAGALFVERYFFPAYALSFVLMLRNFQFKDATFYSFCPMLAVGLLHAFAK